MKSFWFEQSKKQAIITASILTVICFALLMVLELRGAYPTPFKDEFYFYSLYKDALNGTLSLKDLFTPHFGHLYVLPKLILWMNVYFNIDLRIDMYAISLMIAITGGILSYITFRKKNLHWPLISGIIIALAVSSAHQWENLYWALSISTSMMMLFSTISFVITERFTRTRTSLDMILAIGFSILAMFSAGAGIVTLAIISITIFITGHSKQRLFATVTFFIIALLFLSLQISYSTPIASSLLSINNFILYIPAYLASAFFSFSEHGNDPISLMLGTIFLAISLWLITLSFFNWRRNILPISLAVFTLTTCLLIAFTRLKNGIFQPNASRYYPHIMPLIIACITMFNQLPKTILNKIILGTFLATILISNIYAYQTEYGIAPYRFQNPKTAHEQLCSKQGEAPAFDGSLESTDLAIMRQAFCSNAIIKKT